MQRELDIEIKLDYPNIFQRQISCFQSYLKADNPKTITVLQWLKSAKYKQKVDLIRATNDKRKRDKLKATLPAITPSGLFSYRGEKFLIRHSGLIQFDIDFKENKHIVNYTQLKEQIIKIQNVAYCGLSVSGNGFWGLIPIAYPEKHKEHFEALKNQFGKMGIVIDDKPKNVASLRGYSYDDKAYFNPNALIFQLTAKVRQEKQVQVKTKFIPSSTSDFIKRKVEFCISEICKTSTDITGGYDVWRNLGFCLASTYGENGRAYYHAISQYHSDYDNDQTDRQFTQCLKKGGYRFDIDYFFGVCKNNRISYMGMFTKNKRQYDPKRI